MAVGQSPELPSKRSVEALDTMPERKASEGMVEQDEHSSSRKKVKRNHDQPDGEDVQRNPLLHSRGAPGDSVGQEDLKWPARDTDVPLIRNGGKVNRDQKGWGRLPKSVLQCILDHAIADMPVAAALTERWGGNEPAETFLKGVTARVWLAETRGLCSGWKEAIDDHRFWLTFYTRYDAKIRPLAPAERQSTRQIVPTNFVICASHWMRVCTICQFNRPARGLHLMRQVGEGIYINSIGMVAMCHMHQSVCTGCGAEAVPEEFCPEGHEGYTVLEVGERETYDDGDLIEVDSYLCRACRIDSLRFQLRRYLEVFARSGAVRGLRNNFLTMPDAQEYIMRGLGNSAMAAYRTLEWAFLSTALGPYSDELVTMACRMQYLEEYIRYAFTLSPQSNFDKLWREYFQLQRRLWPLRASTFRDDDSYRYNSEAKWNQAREKNFGAVFEPDSLEMYEDLNDRYHALLLRSCHQHLALARVRAGFWVWPGSEIALLVQLPATPTVSSSSLPAIGGHTGRATDATAADVDGSLGAPLLPVFARMASTAQHPFPTQTHIRSERTLLPYDRTNCGGGSTFPIPLTTAADPGLRESFDSTAAAMSEEHVKKADDDIILPSATVVRALDENFHQAMRTILEPALKQLVEVVWKERGRGAVISNIELDREMDNWGVEKVLEGLKRKEVWVVAGQDLVDDMALVSEVLKQKGARAQAEGKQEVKVASPKIELVAETTVYDPSHGITETEADAEQDLGDDAAGSAINVGLEIDERANVSSPIQPPASQHPSRPIKTVAPLAKSDSGRSIAFVPSTDRDDGDVSIDINTSGILTPSESTTEDPAPVTPITPGVPEFERNQAGAERKGERQGADLGSDGDGSIEDDDTEEDISVEMPRGHGQVQAMADNSALARLQALGATADAAINPSKRVSSHAGQGNSSASTPRLSPAVDSPVPPRASQMPPTSNATRDAQEAASAGATPNAEVDESNDTYDGDIWSDDSMDDIMDDDYDLASDEDDPIDTLVRPLPSTVRSHHGRYGDPTVNIKEGLSRDLEGEDAVYGRLICPIRDVPYIPHLPPMSETVKGSGALGNTPAERIDDGQDRRDGKDGTDEEDEAAKKRVDVRSVLVSQLVLTLFKEAREPLRECDCRICRRAWASRR